MNRDGRYDMFDENKSTCPREKLRLPTPCSSLNLVNDVLKVDHLSSSGTNRNTQVYEWEHPALKAVSSFHNTNSRSGYIVRKVIVALRIVHYLTQNLHVSFEN